MKISDYPDLLSDDESSFLITADWLEEQSRNYEAECLRQGHVFSVWLYFLSINLNYTLGYGDGYGYSTSYGYSDRAGDGYGYGYGDGYGYGTGYGDGVGYGYGDGTGYGAGYDDIDDSGKLLLLFFASVSEGILNS
jgi:hypothetical protein